MKLNTLKIIIPFILIMTYNSAIACKYTIREIGFSSLSKVTYVLYRVDENSSFFPDRTVQFFSDSNIKTFGLSLEEKDNQIIKFAIDQNLTLPAYILAAPDGRMLALLDNNIENRSLLSPIRNQLVADLPNIYATVLVVEGKNSMENELAKETILKACTRIENILPNMPKPVDKGPNMLVVSTGQFQEEKVLLWSLGIHQIPDQPIAFILYGKGRLMGEKIDYQQIFNDQVYKLLAIIGADCECGLDRKWMLGYQIPMNWPMETRQLLSDNLGFDVNNPMVLTEMSRILEIENRVASDPDGISYEPITIDLDNVFDATPEIEHQENNTKQDDSTSVKTVILYSFFIFIAVVIGGALLIIKRKNEN